MRLDGRDIIKLMKCFIIINRNRNKKDIYVKDFLNHLQYLQYFSGVRK